MEPGTHVQIIDGPFNGLAGIVLELLQDEGEALVEVELFGSKSDVKAKLSQLKDYPPGRRCDAEKHLRRLCLGYQVHLMKVWWLKCCAYHPRAADLVEEYALFLEDYHGYQDDSAALMEQFNTEYPEDLSDEAFALRWKEEEQKWLDRLAFEPVPTDEALDAASKRQDAAREAFRASGRRDPGAR